MKKIIQLLNKMIREFFLIRKNYGTAFAFYGFIWWLCFYFRTPLSYRLSSWSMAKKTAWLDEYMEKKYADILEKFKSEPPQATPVSEHNIWVFWGQGEAQMPPLVQTCYQQLKKHHRNVILVTYENVQEYITLSPVIFDKVKNGKITWAHFSDIVRNTLLAQYGGLWLDATVWIPYAIPFEKFATMPLFTANGSYTPNSRTMRFWTSFEWSWSSWCLWAKDKNYLLFTFVSRMLKEFAEKESIFPDYVLQDYLIHYACRKYPSIAGDMSRCCTIPCKNRNTLAAIMNEPYEAERYRGLITADIFFKLSFRTAWETKKDGKPTFYGKFIADEL